MDEETKQELGASAGKEAQQAAAVAVEGAQLITTAPAPPAAVPAHAVEAEKREMEASHSFRLPLPAGATSLPVDPHDDPLLLAEGEEEGDHHQLQHHLGFGLGLAAMPGGSSSTHNHAGDTSASGSGGCGGGSGGGGGDASAGTSSSYVPLSDLRFPYYPEALLSTQAMASTSSLEGANSVHSLSLEPAPSLTSLADTSSVGDMSDMASLRDHALLYGRDGAPLYNVCARWGVGWVWLVGLMMT